jgi:hypothetical protein
MLLQLGQRIIQSHASASGAVWAHNLSRCGQGRRLKHRD